HWSVTAGRRSDAGHGDGSGAGTGGDTRSRARGLISGFRTRVGCTASPANRQARIPKFSRLSTSTGRCNLRSRGTRVPAADRVHAADHGADSATGLLAARRSVRFNPAHDSRTCARRKLESLAKRKHRPWLQPSRTGGDPAHQRLLAFFHPAEHGRCISAGYATAEPAAAPAPRAQAAKQPA